jgi:hypothetical protein
MLDESKRENSKAVRIFQHSKDKLTIREENTPGSSRS